MRVFHTANMSARIMLTRIVIVMCLGAIISFVLPSNKSAQNTPTGSIAGHNILKSFRNEYTVRVERVFEDQSGLYWIVNHAGFVIYEEKNDRWTPSYSFPGVPYCSICQSNDKRLWFSTQSSIRPVLRVSDGKTWSKLDPKSYPNSLPADQFIASAMFCSKSGTLWFAIGDKLLSYDGKEWGSLISVPGKGGSPSNVISGLQDSEGSIWLQTSNGITQLDQGTGQWRAYHSPPEFSPRAFLIYEGRDRRMWFVTPSGTANVYDKTTNSWVTHRIFDWLHFQRAGLGESFSSPLITSVYQDRQGRMMFATRHGLLTFLENTKECELFTPANSNLPNEGVTEIMEDKEGRIWLGTYNGLLVLRQ